MDTKRTRPAAYQINDLLVWGPKFRRPVLEGEVGKRLAELIRPIVEENGGEGLDLTGMADPVHLFVSFSPTIAIHPIVFGVQGSPSHPLRKELPDRNSRLPSLRRRRYDAGTAGPVSAGTIQGDIERQKGG